MKLQRTFMIFSVLIVLSITGCGNEGDPGNGNTVYFQSSIKSATTGAIFANISGNSIDAMTILSGPNNMSFTLQSYVYTHSTTIPSSDIDIKRIDFAFTPLEYEPGKTSPKFTPTFKSILYSGRLTPAGSLNIENVPILYGYDLQQIFDETNTALIDDKILKYQVDVTFTGTEVNTGVSLSNTINVTAFVDVR